MLNIAVGLTGFLSSDLSSADDDIPGLYAVNPKDFFGTSRSGSLEVSGLNALPDAKGDEVIDEAKGDGALGDCSSFGSSGEARGLNRPEGTNVTGGEGLSVAAGASFSITGSSLVVFEAAGLNALFALAADFAGAAAVLAGAKGLNGPEGAAAGASSAGSSFAAA